MGIASLIVGISSMLIGFIPVVGGIAFIPAIVAFILGIVSVVQGKKKGEKVGVGIAGIVLSSIALVVIFFWTFIIGVSIFSDTDSNSNKISDSSTTYNYNTNNSVVENNTASSQKISDEKKTYGVGETWEVAGKWRLTIDSVTTTEDRNRFSDKDPAQVVYVTYTYENLGYEDTIMDGLYISLSSNSTVVDAAGEVADTYPNSITTYPSETPVGAKCKGAQECFGLNNVSDKITINFSKYDDKYKKQSATFVLDVQ